MAESDDPIERFAANQGPDEPETLSDLRGYADWSSGQVGEIFVPEATDDVEIRSYLLHLKIMGAGRPVIRRTITSGGCGRDAHGFRCDRFSAADTRPGTWPCSDPDRCSNSGTSARSHDSGRGDAVSRGDREPTRESRANS